jgi:hypothetical protein
VHSVSGAPPPVSPKRVRTAPSIGEIPGIDQPSSENTLGIDPEDYNIKIDWEETPIILSSTIGLNVLVPQGGYSVTGNGLFLKDQLLDPVTPDDDMIDRIEGASVWDNYFNEAQI